jgi:signal transduction histidine kinase
MQALLDISNRQVRKLSELVSDLLDVSRINARRLELKCERFELGGLVREVAERYEEQLKMAQCHVQIDAPQAIEVVWDRMRIEQVLINLISNAIKYAPCSPLEIRLEVEQCDGGHVVMSFRDHGPGVDKAVESRIFERFERAISSAAVGGLGLGLFITKQIVNQHGGTITLDSRTAPPDGKGSGGNGAKAGTGAVFTVRIPREVPQTAGAISEMQAAAAYNTQLAEERRGS